MDKHQPQEGVAGQEESSPKQPVKRAGRRKINIEYIEDKNRRHITFSKRKSGIMKKAYELSTLTGTQVLLLVASETGHVYTFATQKLQPLITKQEGKSLIQKCLSGPGPEELGEEAENEEQEEEEEEEEDEQEETAGTEERSAYMPMNMAYPAPYVGGAMPPYMALPSFPGHMGGTPAPGGMAWGVQNPRMGMPYPFPSQGTNQKHQ